MKELTIEEKAKAYDEALQRAKLSRLQLLDIGEEATEIEYIFPELKAIEDERIRKWIINEIKIKHHNLDEENVDFVDKAIAWLEKQGERKVDKCEGCNNVKGCITCVDGSEWAHITEAHDKVKPKFNVGDFIVSDYCMGRVIEITNDAYLLDTKQGINFSCNNTRLWDITKDAKDGDILVSRSPFIYGTQCPYGGLNWYNNKFIKASNFIFTDSPVHPATKKERNILFSKMKEAGYIWNEKELKLEKI